MRRNIRLSLLHILLKAEASQMQALVSSEIDQTGLFSKDNAGQVVNRNAESPNIKRLTFATCCSQCEVEAVFPGAIP